MEREEFLSKLGIGLAAICAGGCLAACSKSDTGSPATNAPTPPTGVNFTIDLGSEIKNIGESKISSGVIVVRLNTANTVDSFTAVQVACTHEGTAINYVANQTKFVCPNHGSAFSTTGAVLNGPSTGGTINSLKKFNIVISGNTLTVTG